MSMEKADPWVEGLAGMPSPSVFWLVAVVAVIALMVGVIVGYWAGCESSSATSMQAFLNGVRAGRKEALDAAAGHQVNRFGGENAGGEP